MTQSNKDKQIEKMALDLENHACMSRFQAEIASKMLYAKGYCKANDTAEKIIADLETSIDEYLKIYMEERNKEYVTDTPLEEYISGKIDAYSSVKVGLAELRKKYMESEDTE